MQKVLIIAPRHYVKQYEAHYRHENVKLEYFSQEDINKDVETFFNAAKEWQYDGYIGTVDISAVVAVALNARIGVPSQSPEVLARLEDKYLARKTQQELGLYSGLVANCSQIESIADDSFPLFVKPRRATMSYGSGMVASKQELAARCSEENRHILREKNKKVREIYEYLDLPNEIRQGLGDFTIESVQPGHEQIALEGCIQAGELTYFGFAKSVFHKNHRSFKRYDFPYSLPEALAIKIKDFTAAFIKGTGLNYTLFSVEFKIDEQNGDFALIEINLRPSPQVLYPIECVTGVNPLDAAIDIVLGNRVSFPENVESQRVCSVCDLRVEEDAFVAHMPTEAEMQWLYEEFPGSVWDPYAVEGKRLSDLGQDSRTFRYGQVTIPHDISMPVQEYEARVEQRILSLITFKK